MEKEKDQGKRDGAGGGFNDRQDPTDRRTTNSDDDDMYDAFGRKKKKYRIGGVHSVTSLPEDKEEDLPDQENIHININIDIIIITLFVKEI